MTSADLENRVAFVTGAASGIGARTAERLRDAGAIVYAADVHPVAIEGVTSVQLDVTSESGWDGAFRDIDRLDVMVNCAGVIVMRDIIDTSVDEYRKVMAVNVEGVFLGVRQAMRLMLPQRQGSIINISSVAGLVGSPGAAIYCASKGAVRLMTKAVAQEALAAGTEIRVNSVHPSLTATAMQQDIIRQLGGSQDVQDALIESLPASRLATIDEIVEGILFLASDRSRFMNGTELVLDNGFTAQ